MDDTFKLELESCSTKQTRSDVFRLFHGKHSQVNYPTRNEDYKFITMLIFSSIRTSLGLIYGIFGFKTKYCKTEFSEIIQIILLTTHEILVVFGMTLFCACLVLFFVFMYHFET